MLTPRRNGLLVTLTQSAHGVPSPLAEEQAASTKKLARRDYSGVNDGRCSAVWHPRTSSRVRALHILEPHHRYDPRPADVPPAAAFRQTPQSDSSIVTLGSVTV